MLHAPEFEKFEKVEKKVLEFAVKEQVRRNSEKEMKLRPENDDLLKMQTFIDPE